MTAPGLLDLAADFLATAAELAEADHQLRAAIERAGRLQEAVHAAEDRLGELAEKIEAMPATTAAEAAAKRAVEAAAAGLRV